MPLCYIVATYRIYTQSVPMHTYRILKPICKYSLYLHHYLYSLHSTCITYTCFIANLYTTHCMACLYAICVYTISSLGSVCTLHRQGKGTIWLAGRGVWRSLLIHTLHCIALHCIALHCITLHYIYIYNYIYIYITIYIYNYIYITMGFTWV